MKVAVFLHIYQPPTQTAEVLYRICRESYEPIVSILELYPTSRITLNICGSLIEQLRQAHGDLLQKIKLLASRGQVELTGSAIYHPLLTEIPDKEILRQIELNSQLIKSQLDGGGLRGGFFPPELSIDERVCQILKDLGFKYTLADELIIPEDKRNILNQTRLLIDNQSGLNIVCRHKQLSLDIAFSKLTNISEFIEASAKLPHVVLAMDGETFGHHQPEQMNFFRSLMQQNELVTISKLVSTEAPMEIDVVKSSWANSFDRWHNQSNPLHELQWKLLNLAIKTVEEFPEASPDYWEARALLDKGLHSDQFWWSSYNPCWHYKMMEKGAHLLLDSVLALPGELPVKKEAQDLYEKITQTGLKMYGDTVIGC